MVRVTEQQIQSMIRESLTRILESINETPKCDKGKSDDEKKEARRERGDWNKKDHWSYDGSTEKSRQNAHKSSRGVKQDTRMKGQPTKRGEFTNRLIKGKY